MGEKCYKHINQRTLNCFQNCELSEWIFCIEENDFSEIIYSEVHSEPCQISKMERFVKIVNGF